MVIALRAELQNILYTLTSTKLNDALAAVRDVTNKYLNIAREGNQKISSTLEKFIGELEPLFIDAVKIEYEIIHLQNGKAGCVYVISNLGSFGDDVFKVGMTRRLNPQERIDEWGSASVPFKFDVHSFIFSEDAVKLEADLHAALDLRRLNKVLICARSFSKSRLMNWSDWLRDSTLRRNSIAQCKRSNTINHCRRQSNKKSPLKAEG